LTCSMVLKLLRKEMIA